MPGAKRERPLPSSTHRSAAGEMRCAIEPIARCMVVVTLMLNAER
jgi:hypothetical protein